jgi:hypothetical protein
MAHGKLYLFTRRERYRVQEEGEAKKKRKIKGRERGHQKAGNNDRKRKLQSVYRVSGSVRYAA